MIELCLAVDQCVSRRSGSQRKIASQWYWYWAPLWFGFSFGFWLGIGIGIGSTFTSGQWELQNWGSPRFVFVGLYAKQWVRRRRRHRIFCIMLPRSHANRHIYIYLRLWLWVLFPIAVADFHSFITNLIEPPASVVVVVGAPGPSPAVCTLQMVMNWFLIAVWFLLRRNMHMRLIWRFRWGHKEPRLPLIQAGWLAGWPSIFHLSWPAYIMHLPGDRRSLITDHLGL